jgi:hypothetical protein
LQDGSCKDVKGDQQPVRNPLPTKKIRLDEWIHHVFRYSYKSRPSLMSLPVTPRAAHSLSHSN